MKKVKFTLDIGFAGATRTDEFEIEDDATEEEIEAEVQDWVWSYVHYDWEVVE